MKRFKYFELDEFIRSSTAKKKGIENYPSFEVVEHLEELVETILEPLRAAYGMPIIISSGYRCEQLNKAVNGTVNSSHLYGYAADLVVKGSFKKFCDFTSEWVKKAGVRFDQIIIESQAGSKWMHVAVKNGYGQQRGQIFSITK